MLGFISRLFDSSETVNKTVDTVANGLDKLYYSDEEKAEDAAKARTEARTLLVSWMEATQGQNLTRRFIALMIAGCWVFGHVMGFLGSMIAPWISDAEFHKNWMLSITSIDSFTNEMHDPVMLILAFYFAAPHMSSVVNTVLNRMSKK